MMMMKMMMMMMMGVHEHWLTSKRVSLGFCAVFVLYFRVGETQLIVVLQAKVAGCEQRLGVEKRVLFPTYGM